MFHPEPVHLARELLAELFEELLAGAASPAAPQHARFHLVAADGQMVVAPSLVACAEASEPVLARHDESGAADAAFRQAGEQVLRALSLRRERRRSYRVARLLLALLRGGPELVGHDAQGRDFLRASTRLPG